MPTTVLQSINPFCIIGLAPVVGGIWVKMGERNPSLGVKFGMGLVLLGVGFLVLAWGSSFTSAGRVSPMWLVVTYFFHTVGELCLSPVGLSAMTKLSPDRLVSQMMGIWFMGAALGNLIAGLVGGLIENMQLPLLFGTVASVVAGAGLLFWLLTVPIRHLAGGVK
jgi:POT family proton-dependent oligopeptide transporter